MTTPEEHDDKTIREAEHVAAYRAWLRREGPNPANWPAPPHIPAERWESKMRIVLCIGLRARGDIGPAKYVEGMTEEEKLLADGFMYRELAAASRIDLGRPSANRAPTDQPKGV